MFQFQAGDILVQSNKIIGVLIEVQQEKNLMKFYRTVGKKPNQVKRLEGVPDSPSSSSRDKTEDEFGNRKKQKKQYLLKY